jgi:hypothetical protein
VNRPPASNAPDPPVGDAPATRPDRRTLTVVCRLLHRAEVARLGFVFTVAAAVCLVAGGWLEYDYASVDGLPAALIASSVLLAPAIVVIVWPTVFASWIYDLAAGGLAAAVVVALIAVGIAGGVDGMPLDVELIAGAALLATAIVAEASVILRRQARAALSRPEAEVLRDRLELSHHERRYVRWTFSIPAAAFVLSALLTAVAARFALPAPDLGDFFRAAAPLVAGVLVAVVVQPDPPQPASSHPLLRRRRAVGLVLVLCGVVLGAAAMLPGSGYFYAVAFLVVCASLCASSAVLVGTILISSAGEPRLDDIVDELVEQAAR